MKTRKLFLELEIETESSEKESYVFALSETTPEATPRIAFLADLFDLFNFEANLGVQSINGWTHEQIKKALAS